MLKPKPPSKWHGENMNQTCYWPLSCVASSAKFPERDHLRKCLLIGYQHFPTTLLPPSGPSVPGNSAMNKPEKIPALMESTL